MPNNISEKIQKVYVFIDASNLWQAQKSKGRMFDYKKLKSYIKTQFNATVLKIFYYTAYPSEGTRSYNLDSKHQFFTYLKKGLGFTVRKKPLKIIRVESGVPNVRTQEKGNMDVELTIDAIDQLSQYTIALFFTGDSDFLALVSYLKNRNKKVYIFSSKNNISQELRTGGDGYFDVLKIETDIWGNDLKHRKKSIENKNNPHV